jgi:hypothetical protein
MRSDRRTIASIGCFRDKNERAGVGERPSLPPVTILEAKDLADALNVHEAEKVDYEVQ